MEVVDTDSGMKVSLRYTDSLQADLAAWSNNVCPHPSTELRRREVKGGAIQRRQQCLVCGERIGNPQKAVPGENLPPDDEALFERYHERRKRARADILQKHVRLQRADGKKLDDQYATYLKSDAWRSKRSKVLKRAGHICEGCGERSATEVHHLTYQHIYEEFLFELVALCEPCHHRLHHVDEGPVEELPCCACRYAGDGTPQAYCGKFNMKSVEALLPRGPCGPKARELEPLK